MIHPVRITEAAIQKYGYRPLSLWAYAYMKCVNGVVYRGCDEQRIEKLGWSRSKFFASMAMLCDAGLAEKDKWHNWRLLPISGATRDPYTGKRVRHRCTLLLDDTMSDLEVRDVLVLKRVEMAHRQVVYALDPPLKQKIRRDRNRMIEQGIRLEGATTELTAPLMGQSRGEMVKVAKTKGYAPINTKSLLRVTGLGRSALFSWKKRAKRNGWIDQRNRCEDLHPHLYSLLDEFRSIEKHYQGAVSYSPSMNKYLFHQSSTYKLLLQYGIQ